MYGIDKPALHILICSSFTICTGKPTGKSHLGRPGRFWEDIRMNLKETGIIVMKKYKFANLIWLHRIFVCVKFLAKIVSSPIMKAFSLFNKIVLSMEPWATAKKALS